jgi:hypothetical protein
LPDIDDPANFLGLELASFVDDDSLRAQKHIAATAVRGKDRGEGNQLFS